MTRRQRHEMLTDDIKRIEWLNSQPHAAVGAAMFDYYQSITKRPALGARRPGLSEQEGDQGDRY